MKSIKSHLQSWFILLVNAYIGWLAAFVLLQILHLQMPWWYWIALYVICLTTGYAAQRLLTYNRGRMLLKMTLQMRAWEREFKARESRRRTKPLANEDQAPEPEQ